MRHIEIDFEVFKALTARRRDESHTYNEVIRELLDIDSGSAVHKPAPLRENGMITIAEFANAGRAATSGFATRGLFLPNGTLFRATHKGSSYGARIVDGKWLNEEGTEHGSPSAAASAITGNNVNGWRFWQAKRPSDTEWRTLDGLMKS